VCVQLQSSDGTDEQTYSHLLQYLSDVEWTLFRQTYQHSPTAQHSAAAPPSTDEDAVSSAAAGCCSAIDELFTFQVITGRVCDSCHQLSVDVEPTSILTLPLRLAADCQASRNTHDAGGALSVDTCLRGLSSAEQLTAADRVQCARCSNAIPPVDNGPPACDLLAACHSNGNIISNGGGSSPPGCQRRSMLRYCPPYLIVHLLRFTASQAKLADPVAVSRRLLLGNDVVMDDGDDIEYRLRALCCHVDTRQSGGHYVAYAAADDDEVAWHRFDDVAVTRVGDMAVELASSELQRNVYLLFYRRVTPSALSRS